MEYFDLTTLEGGKGKNPRATRRYPTKSPKRPKQTKGARSSSFTTSGQEKASKGLEQRIGNVSPNEESLEQEQETEQKNHNNKAEEQHLNKRALKEEKQAQRRKEEREFMHKYFGIAKSIQKVTNAQRNRANKEKAEQINAIGEKIETKRLSIPQKAYEQALGALESAEAAYEDALRDKILEQGANSVSAGPISQSVGIAIGGPGAPTGGPAGPVGTSSAVIDKAVFDRAFANALNANKNKLYDLTYEIAESYRAMLEKTLRGANEDDIKRAVKNIAVFLQLSKIDTEKYEEVLDNLKDACSSIDTIFLTLVTQKRSHFRQNNTDKLSGYLSDLEEIYEVIESIDNFPKVLLMSLSVEINNLKDLTEFDIPAKENKNYGEKMEEYSDILNIVYTINTELLSQLNVFQIMKKHFDINNLVKKLKEKIFRLNYLVEETTKIIKEYLKYDYGYDDERLGIILESREEIRELEEEIDEIKGVLSEEGVTREVLNKEYGVKITKSIDVLTPESLRVLKKSTKEVKNRDKKIDELKGFQNKLNEIDETLEQSRFYNSYLNNDTNREKKYLKKEKNRLERLIFQLELELYGSENSIYKQKLNAIFESNLYDTFDNKNKKEQKDMGHRIPYLALMRKKNSEWKESTGKRRGKKSIKELTPINKMKNSEKKELYDLVKASALYRLIFENKPIETNEEKNELKSIGALYADNSLSDKFEKSFKAEWEKLEKWYKKYQERENELKTRKILSPNTNVRTPIEKEKGIEKLKLTQLDAPAMKASIKKNTYIC